MNPLGGLSTPTFPLAYAVVVRVGNVGTGPILFDEIQGAFVPSAGPPLVNRTFAYDEARDADVDAYVDGDNEPIALETGETLDFNFTTNGYTGDLLADANGLPLQVHIALFRSGSRVAGPFVADLPEAMSLSPTGRTPMGSGQALTLSFRRR